jgi:hypothetical protein
MEFGIINIGIRSNLSMIRDISMGQLAANDIRVF